MIRIFERNKMIYNHGSHYKPIISDSELLPLLLHCSEILKAGIFWLFIISVQLYLFPAASNSDIPADAGTAGLKFLQVSRSPRGTALGDAGVALSGDIAASWYNPALAVSLKSRSVEVTRFNWISDIIHNTAEFGWGNSTQGFIFGLRLVSSGDLEFRPSYPTREPIGEYGIYDGSFFTTYAMSPYENISLGITAKYLYEKIHTESASGYGIDLGVFYKIPDFGLSFGAAMRNIGKMGKLGSQKFDLPTDFSFGLSARTPFEVHGIYPSLNFAYRKPRDYNSTTGFGVEVPFASDYARFRLGYLSGSEIRDVSYGLGVNVKWFSFDITVIPTGFGFGNLYHISLRARNL